MHQPKRKFRLNRRGVSDIIGNILILGITVTLFSSIMIYVTNMPTPQQNSYADFSSQVAVVPHAAAPMDVYINLTFKGGQPLSNASTSVYIWVDGAFRNVYLSSGGIATTWTTGMVWNYHFTKPLGSNPAPSIQVMIIDKVKNSQVWSSTLTGGSPGSGTPPMIGDRGTTPQPSYIGDPIMFYVTVTDLDGDLVQNSVYADLTPLGLTSVRMSDANNDGIFTVGPYTSLTSWNGQTVVFNATDSKGHTAVGRLTVVLQVKPTSGGSSSQYGPFYNYSSYLVNGTYPPDASGGEAGQPVGTTFYYIRRQADMVITKNFNPGQKVLIEVYSDALANLALDDSFTLIHPITGQALTPPTDTTNAFQYGGIYGTFHRYIFNFSAPSDPYSYPIAIKLKDSSGTIINLADNIVVGGVIYPRIDTYALKNGVLVKTSNFNHTDTVYVRIVTKDVDLYSNTVYMSDFEVSDYTGRYIIQKVPPSYSNPPYYSAPISSLFKTSGTSPTPGYENTKNGQYTMYTILKDAYQGWWLPRKNAYTIKILQFSDTGSGSTTAEVYNDLTAQINVTAPLSTTDLVATVGSGSFTWSASGATWSSNKVSWYAGGTQWDETVIDPEPNQGCIGIALADISGDGRNDVVIGCQDPNYANLVWYENQKADGSAWSSGRGISMPFDALSGLQAAGGNDQGNPNEDVSVFATRDNGGSFEDSYTCTNELCGAIAVADLNHDGKGDIVASFLHVVVYSTATSAGSADATNSYGMYFNRGIYVFWNDGNWTRTTLYSTDSWVAANAANKNTNPAAMDLACGDFDQDGYPDIVAVYETGATTVWMNQWAKSSGDVRAHENNAFGTAASVRNLPAMPSAECSNPWDHVQYIPRVRVADMNLDGYPDIVRTNTVGKDMYVIYTVPGARDQVTSTAQYEYKWNASTTASRVVGPPEQLTERYLNYTPTAAVPSMLSASDTTGSNINDLMTNNSVDFNVGPSKTMYVTYWTLDPKYTGCTVAKATIYTKFKVDSGYAGTGKVQYSIDGTNFFNTTIQPVAADTAYRYASFNLPQGSLTYSAVQNMKVRFTDNDAGGRTVHFDFVNVTTTFVQTRQLGWVWQIPNAVRANHNMTFTGHVSGAQAESFRLAYSVDNTTWLNLTDVSWTSDGTFYANLTYTPSAYYWIRIVDNNRAGTDTSNNTFWVTTLNIRHYALTVSWDSSHTYKIPWTSPDYITCFAIGDIGKLGGDHKPDGVPDIVVCTAKVGSGNDLNTMFIMTQDVLGTFNVRPVYTTQMSVLCSNPAQYDTKAVELGDNDGDGFLDIAVVVGAPPGIQPGTGPTLWSYMNKLQYSTGASAWQFTESYINVLATKGDSAINVKEGDINLSMFLPFLGVLGVIVAEAVVERKKRR